ncbi:hypothetical protein E3N88_07031 [Mikania micrantha]|uniref:Uncharacterized protein n=1 Tax=Mikania micrantha TaxID=192012 RepID=A0A5N6PSG1_9ASTR|nr:hypothetical protein E3N88_07031 [Mikania micrantha]
MCRPSVGMIQLGETLPEKRRRESDEIFNSDVAGNDEKMFGDSLNVAGAAGGGDLVKKMFVKLSFDVVPFFFSNGL